MSTLHVSEQMRAAQVKSALAYADGRGLLVDADLSSAAAAKTAVSADVAKLHVSEQLLAPRINAAIDMAESLASGYTTGTDASDWDTIPPSGVTPKGLAPRF